MCPSLGLPSRTLLCSGRLEATLLPHHQDRTKVEGGLRGPTILPQVDLKPHCVLEIKVLLHPSAMLPLSVLINAVTFSTRSLEYTAGLFYIFVS